MTDPTTVLSAEEQATVAWITRARTAIYLAAEPEVASDIAVHLVKVAELIDGLVARVAEARTVISYVRKADIFWPADIKRQMDAWLASTPAGRRALSENGDG